MSWWRPSLDPRRSCFRFGSETEPRYDLPRPRLSRASIEGIHESVTLRQRAQAVSDGGSGRIHAADSEGARAGLHANRVRKKQAIKHVLEFRADLKIDVPFAMDDKFPADAQRFRRLPLPAIVVVVCCRSAELAWSRIHPRRRIQY